MNPSSPTGTSLRPLHGVGPHGHQQVRNSLPCWTSDGALCWGGLGGCRRSAFTKTVPTKPASGMKASADLSHWRDAVDETPVPSSTHKRQNRAVPAHEATHCPVKEESLTRMSLLRTLAACVQLITEAKGVHAARKPATRRQPKAQAHGQCLPPLFSLSLLSIGTFEACDLGQALMAALPANWTGVTGNATWWIDVRDLSKGIAELLAQCMLDRS